MTQTRFTCATHPEHLVWGGPWWSEGQDREQRLRRALERDFPLSDFRPLGAECSRGVGPALYPARARPGRPAHAGPCAAVRPSAAEGAGMRGAAATLRRRARPGGRKESAMPTPGNGTGKGRGCGPRAGVCAHYTDGKGEGLRAQPRAGAGGGGRWAALCRGEVHTRRLTPPASLRRPAGAPAELKPGSECPEARRLRLAARQPRCAPFPSGGRLGVMRGMTARRTRGNRNRPYLGEMLRFAG